MKLDRSLYAWFLLILLSVIWGISPMLIKKSLISLHPLEIGTLRLSFAAIILLPFLAKNIKEVKKKDFLILFISGIVGNVIPYFLYPIAQTKIDSGTSGVLTSLTPFFALIIGVLFYNQKATKNNLIGLTIGFLGTVALILFANNTRGFGSDIFGLFGLSSRTPFEGLWLCGDSIYPGEGTAGVSQSALMVSRQILASKGIENFSL